jgi:hypothetical protein
MQFCAQDTKLTFRHWCAGRFASGLESAQQSMTENIIMKTIGTIALALCLVGFNSVAADAPNVDSLRSTLGAAPAPELPALAAKLIQEAPSRDREATTISVVKVAVGINPAAAPLIVGAIARAVPEMAAVAAGTASTAQPKQAAAIAKAAARSAPARAGKIVGAVCGAVPQEYSGVAVAVSEAAPTSGKDILTAVGATVPSLKVYIDKELAGSGLAPVPVASTLETAQRNAGIVSRPLGAPSGAPYVPPASTTSGAQPDVGGSTSGGRQYSSPH